MEHFGALAILSFVRSGQVKQLVHTKGLSPWLPVKGGGSRAGVRRRGGRGVARKQISRCDRYDSPWVPYPRSLALSNGRGGGAITYAVPTYLACFLIAAPKSPCPQAANPDRCPSFSSSFLLCVCVCTYVCSCRLCLWAGTRGVEGSACRLCENARPDVSLIAREFDTDAI